MALKDYGKGENDPGTWVDFGLDKPFRLRLRRIPQDVWEAIDKRHLKTGNFEVRDGIRRRVKDQDEVVAALTDKALFAWTDADGLEVEIAHEDSAALWGKLLSRTISVGETVSLTGNALTHAVKLRVLEHLKPIARVEEVDEETGSKSIERREIGSFIVLEAAKLQRDFAKIEEERAKN